MAAEVEEVVGQADAVEAEQVGHEVAEQGLLGGGGGHVVGGQAAALGRRQGGAVELAVGGQRQRRQHHERRRDHVVRQLGGQVLAQGLEVERVGLLRRRLAGHEVGDEARVAGAVGAGDDRGLGDGGCAGQRGLDLAGLDAEAAQLELEVGAAVEVQFAVGAPGGAVAGAVEPLAGGDGEGVGDEALGGQTRPVPVAACQAGAGDVQLPHHPRRAGLQVRIEHVDARVGDRCTDGLGIIVRIGAAAPCRTPDSGLRHPVLVEQVDALMERAVQPDRLRL